MFMKESEICWVTSDSLRPHGLDSPWNSPGQNTGVGSLSLLQGIFPTQESIWDLLHSKQIFLPTELSGKNSLIFPQNLKKRWLLAFHKQKDRGSEKLSNLPEITQLSDGVVFPVWF